MGLGRARLQQLQQGSHKGGDRGDKGGGGGEGGGGGGGDLTPLRQCLHGVSAALRVKVLARCGLQVFGVLGGPQLRDDVDDQAVEHLADSGVAAAKENCHRPVRLVGHVGEEPAAGACRAVKLLGQQLHPLHNIELLLGVDEGFKEEGGGQLAGQQGNVRPTARLAAVAPEVPAQCGRDVSDHLPHEVEVRVVKDIVVLNEVSVVLPDPVFQLGR